MSTEHIVALCHWRSSFDQQERAPALQDLISRWSDTGLKDELNRCFSARCPPTQSWRIDTLRLDLGEIVLDDLAQELPRRLRASLNATLDRLLAQPASASADAAQEQLQVVEHADLLQDYCAWFLQHGSAPWWHQDSRSAAQMADAWLDTRADSAVAMVRALGRTEPVRRRLVWQFGEVRVRRLVHLLEPWHGDFVCAYVDNLFAVQAQRGLPATAGADYRDGVWLGILTYLLVDRGTLFNTIAFVRAGIWHIARQYGIEPPALLAQMFEAVRALRPLGVVSAAFLVAIDTLHQEQQRRWPTAAAAVAVAAPAPDHWPLWQTMLRHGRAQQTVDQDSVSYAELFGALVQQDGERMARSLRREGASAGVRQAMLRHLPASALVQAVRVLAPQDHLFIVAHYEHTQQLAQLGHVRRWDKGAVWQVLLAYLLLARDSHFNRRQLVRDTLRRLCETHGYQLGTLLHLLIHAVAVEHPHQHRFELLTILRELEKESGGAAGAPAGASALLRYLRTGADRQGAEHDGATSAALRELSTGVQGEGAERDGVTSIALRKPSTEADGDGARPDGAARDWPAQRLLVDALQSGDAAALLRHPELAGLSAVLLSRRLLALAGAVELSTLLETLAPGAADFCLPLYQRLRDGQRRGELSSLDRIDLAFQLPALLLQALPALQDRRDGAAIRFDAAAYWPQLCLLLERQARVDMALLLWQWQASAAHAPAHADALDAVVLRTTPSALATRAPTWPQPAHLPPALRRPQEVLTQWSALLRHGGCWQGAAAVLERHLAGVFCTVVAEPRAHRLSAAVLLARMTHSACLRLGLDLAQVLAGYGAQLPALPQGPWHEAYTELQRQPRRQTQLQLPPAPGLAAHDASDDAGDGNDRNDRGDRGNRNDRGDRGEPAGAAFHQDHLGHYLRHPRLPDIARHLLLHGRAPSWLPRASAVDLPRLLHDLFHRRPDYLPALLAQVARRPAAQVRLGHIVPFGWLAAALRGLFPQQGPEIALLQQLHEGLQKVAVPGVNRGHWQVLLMQPALRHGLAGEWAALAPEQLAGRLVWQLLRLRPVGLAALRQALTPQLGLLPERWRRALSAVLRETMVPPTRRPVPPPPAPALHGRALPMRIGNVGLVLLQSFVQPLLSRLQMVHQNGFVSEVEQRRAVHYLQFLVTGQLQTPEPSLVLNKLLCGLAPQAPVEAAIEMTAAEVDMCESLLASVINYWPEIGKTSIDGLRGNWLVRDGSLTNAGDHWELIADRRAYDVLLARLPLSYSVIKLPWMEKAMYVTWPT